MLIAESNLTRLAERWGNWPDVSFGYSQITVATAKKYGIGDGTYNSALVVRDALFDAETSIKFGARHLAYCMNRARIYDDSLEGDDLILNGLIIYNSGGYHPEGDWYWLKYRSHIDRYINSLKDAKIMLGEMQ